MVGGTGTIGVASSTAASTIWTGAGGGFTGVWSRALAAMGAAVTYDNYKAVVGLIDGPERALLYTELWSLMRDAEDRLRPEPAQRRTPLVEK